MVYLEHTIDLEETEERRSQQKSYLRRGSSKTHDHFTAQRPGNEMLNWYVTLANLLR